MSRKKLLDWTEELIPIFLAHTDGSGSTDYGTQAARSYHKYTQGYDMMAGGNRGYGDWDLSRMTPYIVPKLVRFVGNATGIVGAINKRLPKGINL